jgi:hypothetical protein
MTNTNKNSWLFLALLLSLEIYDKIINQIKTDSGINNADQLPENAIIGSDGNDNTVGTYRRERIIGNGGNDTLNGGEGNANDRLQGDGGNDFLDGGEGDKDFAIFSEEYTTENYSIQTTGTTTKTTTITHKNGGIDGVDALQNIEWGQFKGENVPIGNQRTLASATTSPPRILPLPLEDGVEGTESVKAVDNTVNPNPNDPPTPPHVSLTMPVAMLDGNVDYTLNISPYKPDTQYNISYIFDTSASMNAGELQAAKNAYQDLTNYFIDNELAENINFGVVKFSRNATLYKNLTAQQAISTIQGLTSSPAIEGTEYDNALYEGFNFLSQSPLDALNTTNIAYFVSDGRSDISRNFYHDDAQRLRNFANVQAFGIYDSTDPAGVTQSQINFVDSNNGVLVELSANKVTISQV